MTLSVTSENRGVIHGIATATIEPGWHINSNKPLDEYLIPTEFTLAGRHTLLKVSYPPHVERTFSFSPDPVAVYEGTVRFPFEAKRSAGPSGLEAKLSYQACNDSVCLPPSSVAARLGGAQDNVGGNFTLLTDAPSQTPPSLFSSDVVSTFASRGLLITLVAVFFLGLALNLTPCVYPLIPITIAFFATQSEGRRSQRVLLSAAYVLGIAITYSTLGVFSALSGRLFGAWLQHPAVLIFFSLLMLILAASMFGAFDIRVPHFISDRASARGGLAGALSMGLLVGIVAAPCVGPFVISLIALVSQSGSALLGFTLFFVLALGLGLPYLLLGIFSSSLQSLPRSGAWMDDVKKAMGFVLVAMAFYFLRPLIGETAYTLGVGVSLVAGALFLLLTGAGGRALRFGTVALLLGGGIFFLWPRPKSEGVQWIAYEDLRLASAQFASKPVIIDFYADWCLPCKELDHKTFNQISVVGESRRFVRLKADLTRTSDESVKQLTARYRISGVPTIVFLDSAGHEVKNKRLTGFEKPEPFLQRMRAVK